MFALHPLHVESVAWVAERKDVLSGLFCFLTLLLYSEYVVTRKSVIYTLSVLSFVLGLMAKPMLVTLPIVMLLVDFWPLGRYRHVSPANGLPKHSCRIIVLVKEKIPFFVCSLLSGIVTICAQHAGGAVVSLSTVAFHDRIGNALVSYVKYVGKTFYPQDLAVFYPYTSISRWEAAGSMIILAALSTIIARTRHRYPYLAMGWLWFIITLLPVIGLLQVGIQSMADRYTYIPVVGLFIMAAWGGADMTNGLRYRKAILGILASAALIVATILTCGQLGYWRDNLTLYRHTLQITDNNYFVTYNLGVALADKGDMDSAIEAYRTTLRIYPNFYMANHAMGIVFMVKGQLDEAIKEFRLALRTNPDYAVAHYSLGLALAGEGSRDAAIYEYREALRINPEDKAAHIDLGVALASKGDRDAAIHEYREAVRISPSDATAHINLGVALADKGDLNAAIHEYLEVLRVSPNDPTAHNYLGIALAGKGDLTSAIQEFKAAILINPNYTDAHNNLGQALTLNEGTKK